MKTRAELKEELLRTIPHGEECKYLAEQEAKLKALQARLQVMQVRRAELRRGITLRERKLRDWKGKIPRLGGIPSASVVASIIQTLPPVMCVAVATIAADAQYVRVSSQFMPALNGLGDFEKVWLILLANAEDSDDSQPEAELDQEHLLYRTSNDRRNVYLVVVNVVACDARTGLLRISCLPTAFAGAEVLDIKPYLAYCEAWPKTSIVNQSKSATPSCGLER